MNICIIGDGLTSLSFAKNLINKKINVHIYEIKQNIKYEIKSNYREYREIILNFLKKEFTRHPKKKIHGE